MDKIIDNNVTPELYAKFFLLDDTEESWLYGEIEIDGFFEDFISLIKEEVEYTWGAEYSNMNDYIFYYIDTNDKNTLKIIKDNEIYQAIKKFKDLYIAIIHKKIPYRIIENIPPLFDWFMEYYLY